MSKSEKVQKSIDEMKRVIELLENPDMFRFKTDDAGVMAFCKIIGCKVINFDKENGIWLLQKEVFETD